MEKNNLVEVDGSSFTYWKKAKDATDFVEASIPLSDKSLLVPTAITVDAYVFVNVLALTVSAVDPLLTTWIV